MRVIGHLPEEAAARAFGNYLYVQGIGNEIEFLKDDGWAVWVADEDKIEAASRLFAEYKKNPAESKFQVEPEKADRMRAEEAAGEAAYRKKVRTRRQLFGSLGSYGFGPLTFILIAISVVVFVRSGFGDKMEAVSILFITDPTMPRGHDLATLMPEIRQGQIWRLFTPMFVHFGPLHILFNMLWLRDLGSMIEGRQSTFHLVLLTLVIAAASNFAELYWGGVAFFGGMSGVVYGLLGYVWIRGKFDPASGLGLHSTTVTMMLVWFVLCYTGWIGHVANTAHAAGLVLGSAWGYLSSLGRR
jgi:GlpG protein